MPLMIISINNKLTKDAAVTDTEQLKNYQDSPRTSVCKRVEMVVTI
jgi:hypothetical protein